MLRVWCDNFFLSSYVLLWAMPFRSQLYYFIFTCIFPIITSNVLCDYQMDRRIHTMMTAGWIEQQKNGKKKLKLVCRIRWNGWLPVPVPTHVDVSLVTQKNTHTLAHRCSCFMLDTTFYSHQNVMDMDVSSLAVHVWACVCLATTSTAHWCLVAASESISH